jgi:membrane fusion protein, multidrug efflux system
MTARLPLLLLLPLSQLAACGPATAENAPPPPVEGAGDPSATRRVEVVAITPSAATLDIRLPGEVVGGRDATLAAAAGGFVEAVLVEEGAAVRKGQSLVRVNSSVAAAQLRQAEAQRTQAESDLRRVEAIGDMASAAQLDAARTALALAQAGEDLARIAVSRSVLSAPFDGTVAQVGVEVGEVAAPGAPALRLVQLDPISVTLSVGDREVGSLQAGMDVVASVEALAGTFPGTLQSVTPAADLRTRAFVAEASFPNPDHRLLPGMIASVSLARPVAEGAIVLPQDWLVTRLGAVGVFLVDERDGRAVARWQEVRVGPVVGQQVVLEGGVGPGDRVVVNGHRDLADGDALLLARTGTCCTNGRAVF